MSNEPASPRPTPAITLDEIGRFLREIYGRDGVLERLPGENLNLRVADDNVGAVLKIGTVGQSSADFEFEDAIVGHLGGKVDLALPESVPAVDGRKVTTFVGADGVGRPARLCRFLDGTPWHEAERAAALYRDLGCQLATIDLALADFEHPLAGRTHPWNLAVASDHRPTVTAAEPEDRPLLDEALRRVHAVRSELRTLPSGVIHGDANEGNVLVSGGRVVGLVDFGDALRNPWICELATAIAYAMLERRRPLDDAGELIDGYRSVRTLTDAEFEVLPALVVGRLAMSLAIAAGRKRIAPEHPTWYRTERPVRALLSRLLELPADALLERCSERASEPSSHARPQRGLLLEERRRRIGPSLSLAYSEPLTVSRGRGQYLFDERGRPYLDLVNNVCHVGHCHPRVVAAGQAQMARLNTNSRYLYAELTDYAARLSATFPVFDPPLEVCYFVNSGSEANELALRLARAATGRRELLVVDGAYHGHTSTLIDASPYKFSGPGGSGVAEPWVHTVPMPDPYRSARELRGADSAAPVRDAFTEAEGRIAAFMIEPLLGCGGQVVPPDGYLAAAFEHARAGGGVAIADEVQVGFGRVGSHFWAFDEQHARPDIVVLGKPIGNGHPMAAVVTTRPIADAFDNGMEFFSTFGGNPVSCAIGMAVLDVLEEERLQQHALELGDHLRTALGELAERHPSIGDVRGRGLFAGIELVTDRSTRQPATDLAGRLVDHLRQRGVLLSTDGPLRNVLKIKPPLVLDEDDVDSFVRALDLELDRAG